MMDSSLNNGPLAGTHRDTDGRLIDDASGLPISEARPEDLDRPPHPVNDLYHTMNAFSRENADGTCTTLAPLPYTPGQKRFSFTSLALSNDGTVIYELVPPEDLTPEMRAELSPFSVHSSSYINPRVMQQQQRQQAQQQKEREQLARKKGASSKKEEPTLADSIARVLSSLHALPSFDFFTSLAAAQASLQPASDPSYEQGILLSDLEDEPASPWLWPGYISSSAITLLEGSARFRNNAFLYDLAARVSSNQPMPDGSACQHPGHVIIISPSTDPVTYILPFLRAAGADLSLITLFDRTQTPTFEQEHEGAHTFQLCPQDLVRLSQCMERTQPSLVIFTHLSSILPSEKLSYRETFSTSLSLLQRLLQEYQTACIVARQPLLPGSSHLSSRSERSYHFTEQAQSIFHLTTHPFETNHFLLACSKQMRMEQRSPTLDFSYQRDQHGLHFLCSGLSYYTDQELCLPVTNRISTQHRRIFRILDEAEGKLLGVSDIFAEIDNMSREALKKALQRLTNRKLIFRHERDQYALFPSSIEPDPPPSNSSTRSSRAQTKPPATHRDTRDTRDTKNQPPSQSTTHKDTRDTKTSKNGTPNSPHPSASDQEGHNTIDHRDIRDTNNKNIIALPQSLANADETSACVDVRDIGDIRDIQNKNIIETPPDPPCSNDKPSNTLEKRHIIDTRKPPNGSVKPGSSTDSSKKRHQKHKNRHKR